MSYPRGTLIFVQSSGNFLSDILIRLASGSGVVHCGIADGTGKMLNARGTVCYSNEVEGTEIAKPWPGTPEQLEKAFVFLTQQLGKPYDYLHLVANPIWNLTHWDIGCSAPKRWVCSTLLAAAMREVGLDVAPQKPLATITPQDLLNY